MSRVWIILVYCTLIVLSCPRIRVCDYIIFLLVARNLHGYSCLVYLFYLIQSLLYSTLHSIAIGDGHRHRHVWWWWCRRNERRVEGKSTPFSYVIVSRPVPQVSLCDAKRNFRLYVPYYYSLCPRSRRHDLSHVSKASDSFKVDLIKSGHFREWNLSFSCISKCRLSIVRVRCVCLCKCAIVL